MPEENPKLKLPFTMSQLAGWLVAALLALLVYLGKETLSKVSLNGDKVIEIGTVQRGVVSSLEKITIKVDGTITRAEHDALAVRVTNLEKEMAEARARDDSQRK